MESKRNETFAMIFLGPEDIQRAWSARRQRHEAATRSEGTPRGVAPPPLWAPRDSTDLFLPPKYSQISQNLPGDPQNHFSTAATFYTREIPSRGLFLRPAGGGFDHGGLLHQHHCLSDEA